MSQEAARAPEGGTGADGDLVIALQKERSTPAFEALVRRYQRPLYGFIARQLGDRARAEDVFQQAVFQIYSRINTCARPEAFKSWAFGVAANACRNADRSERLRAVEPLNEVAVTVPSVQATPEQAAVSAQAAQRIAAALHELPSAQREVFVLYHYSQLSYDDIAEALGVPTGTVKSRMNGALSRLRTLLAELRPDRAEVSR
jgi:RNA polymerase sigma-70 factor, ECF subfamily